MLPPNLVDALEAMPRKVEWNVTPAIEKIQDAGGLSLEELQEDRGRTQMRSLAGLPR
jgi:hypothetical protein